MQVAIMQTTRTMRSSTLYVLMSPYPTVVAVCTWNYQASIQMSQRSFSRIQFQNLFKPSSPYSSANCVASAWCALPGMTRHWSYQPLVRSMYQLAHCPGSQGTTNFIRQQTMTCAIMISYVDSRMMLLNLRWSAWERFNKSSMSMIGSILFSITFNITFNTRTYLGIFSNLNYTFYPSLLLISLN